MELSFYWTLYTPGRNHAALRGLTQSQRILAESATVRGHITAQDNITDSVHTPENSLHITDANSCKNKNETGDHHSDSSTGKTAPQATGVYVMTAHQYELRRSDDHRAIRLRSCDGCHNAKCILQMYLQPQQ